MLQSTFVVPYQEATDLLPLGSKTATLSGVQKLALFFEKKFSGGSVPLPPIPPSRFPLALVPPVAAATKIDARGIVRPETELSSIRAAQCRAVVERRG